MRHKKKQGKNSRKKVYTMRHLNEQEAKAFHAKEGKKKQDNLGKNKKMRLENLLKNGK